MNPLIKCDKNITQFHGEGDKSLFIMHIDALAHLPQTY